jgi:ankyrin repeat protein
MYQKAYIAAASGYAEPDCERDPLIAQEPPLIPIEHDYSGFDIVKATQYGAIARVRELVEAGSDVNQPDSATVTLLHWAAINNRRDIIKYFLEKIIISV